MYFNYFTNQHGEWIETEKDFTRTFIVPGASKKDIDVKFENNVIIISFEGNDHTNSIDSRTRVDSKFSTKDVSAKLEAGVLTITVKKPEGFSEKIKVE